jgi:DUF2934 family protein
MPRPSSNESSPNSRGDDAVGTKSQGIPETKPGNAVTGHSLRQAPVGTRTTSDETAPQATSTEPMPEDPGEDRYEAIARAAYYRAEQRGFAPGLALDDWLEAEREWLEKEGALDLR